MACDNPFILGCGYCLKKFRKVRSLKYGYFILRFSLTSELQLHSQPCPNFKPSMANFLPSKPNNVLETLSYKSQTAGAKTGHLILRSSLFVSLIHVSRLCLILSS